MCMCVEIVVSFDLDCMVYNAGILGFDMAVQSTVGTWVEPLA